jgi:hypothetical protein
MTLRRPGQDAVLTSEEIAMLRGVLVCCSHVLAWAGAHAGPGYHQAVADITGAAGRGRTAGALYYDVSLAVDYLDFAPAARNSR